VIEISWIPALLLMLMRVFRPLHTHRSFRARKSAVAAVVVAVVVVGGGGLSGFPFQTTSAQDGELETEKSCETSCGRLAEDPASRPAPTTLPASGGAEP
jgi:hypothetical protein